MERRGCKSQHPPKAISQSCRVVESNQQANRHTAGKIEAPWSQSWPGSEFRLHHRTPLVGARTALRHREPGDAALGSILRGGCGLPAAYSALIAMLHVRPSGLFGCTSAVSMAATFGHFRCCGGARPTS